MGKSRSSDVLLGMEGEGTVDVVCDRPKEVDDVENSMVSSSNAKQINLIEILTRCKSSRLKGPISTQQIFYLACQTHSLLGSPIVILRLFDRLQISNKMRIQDWNFTFCSCAVNSSRTSRKGWWWRFAQPERERHENQSRILQDLNII